MKRHEQPIHIAIVNYLRAVLPRDWLVHHSRNGGMSKAENGRAKAMGAVKGWPDIEIAGRCNLGSLSVPAFYFIEVKKPKQYPDSDQRKVHADLRRLGNKVGIARSIDDARALVREWGLPSREAHTSIIETTQGGDAA